LKIASLRAAYSLPTCTPKTICSVSCNR